MFLLHERIINLFTVVTHKIHFFCIYKPDNLISHKRPRARGMLSLRCKPIKINKIKGL
ncbi:MAG: hypothetical protein RJA24_434 [Pseudomonadota bacterium]